MKLALALSLLIIAASGYSLIASEYFASLLPGDVSALSGEQINSKLRRTHEFCEDSRVREALIAILDSVVPHPGDTQYRVDVPAFAPISSTIFTLPGGRIFVGAEFLDKTDSPAEVAAVIAHEIGHIEAMHAERGYINTLGTWTRIRILLNLIIAHDETKNKLAQSIGEYLRFKARDSAEELEADAFGISLLNSAGYDPAALVQALEKLFSQAPEQSRQVEAVRLEIVRRMAQKSASGVQDKESIEKKLTSAQSARADWAELKNLCRTGED